MNRTFELLHVAKEGKRVILPALTACILLSCLFPDYCPLFVIAFTSILFFFRDPVRDIPDTASEILSPADGRIMDIDHVILPGLDDKSSLRISIFLSILDVHIQRSPYPGEIYDIQRKAGKFFPAFREKASRENEYNFIFMRTDIGPMGIKQIAGSLARRIVCNISVGERISLGDKLGMILFGSRVELFIPPSVEIRVRPGDRLIAVRTVIGKAPQA